MSAESPKFRFQQGHAKAFYGGQCSSATSGHRVIQQSQSSDYWTVGRVWSIVSWYPWHVISLHFVICYEPCTQQYAKWLCRWKGLSMLRKVVRDAKEGNFFCTQEMAMPTHCLILALLICKTARKTGGLRRNFETVQKLREYESFLTFARVRLLWKDKEWNLEVCCSTRSCAVSQCCQKQCFAAKSVTSATMNYEYICKCIYIYI